MKLVLTVLGLMAGLPLSFADAQAQSVYVPHGGRTVELPLTSVASPLTAMVPPSDGGLVRIDGLPAGTALAVDGRLVGAELGGGWIVLSPGPHFIDVALPGGGAIRLTVVTPV